MQSVCGGLSRPECVFLSLARPTPSPARFQALPCFRQPSRSSSFGLNGQLALRYRNPLSTLSRLGSKSINVESLLRSLMLGGRMTVSALASGDSEASIDLSLEKRSGVPIVKSSGVDMFRGKSGSVSFYGLTHQLVEEGKIESAPFVEGKGSFMWLLAPIALISSLILPQFFLSNAVEAFVKNETVAEIVISFFFETMFYAGLAMFLLITDRVQRPFLQFSPKRWSLITGLRGYLNSVFLTMGFKVVIPLFMVYITWPVVGLPALVAVAPFLFGCLVQLIFEKILDRNGSSCWPVVPIIFEVYRLYQLTKAAHYIERLMYAMKDLPTTPELLDRSGALVAMIVSFQFLGLLCLWSLITFLLRLFPSRPVAENY